MAVNKVIPEKEGWEKTGALIKPPGDWVLCDVGPVTWSRTTVSELKSYEGRVITLVTHESWALEDGEWVHWGTYVVKRK